MFVAKAPMREPMKKTIMAARRMGLRPKMSLILPHGGVAADLRVSHEQSKREERCVPAAGRR